MNPCARGCCWTPFSCASARACACHWDEKKPVTRNTGNSTTYPDPTATQAVRNVMRGQQPKPR